jgi:hypothetical protein
VEPPTDREFVDALRRVANLALWCCLAGELERDEPEPTAAAADHDV